MRRVPGASPPRPSSCRRSQFPHSPWRWPNKPPRAKLPSQTCFAFTHPHPSHGHSEGRSFPKRPAFPFCGQRKRRPEFPPPSPRRSRKPQVFGFGAELLVAGAAGLAGVAERGGHGREVARARRDSELVDRRRRHSSTLPGSPPCRSTPSAGPWCRPCRSRPGTSCRTRASSVLSLAACGTIVFTSPLASITPLIARIVAASPCGCPGAA